MMFEIKDFPPIFEIFDSHSLWHLATIFVIQRWYRFLVANVLAEVRPSVEPKAK
jgi:hypothetical protein